MQIVYDYLTFKTITKPLGIGAVTISATTNDNRYKFISDGTNCSLFDAASISWSNVFTIPSIYISNGAVNMATVDGKRFCLQTNYLVFFETTGYKCAYYLNGFNLISSVFGQLSSSERAHINGKALLTLQGYNYIFVQYGPYEAIYIAFDPYTALPVMQVNPNNVIFYSQAVIIPGSTARSNVNFFGDFGGYFGTPSTDTLYDATANYYGDGSGGFAYSLSSTLFSDIIPGATLYDPYLNTSYTCPAYTPSAPVKTITSGGFLQAVGEIATIVAGNYFIISNPPYATYQPYVFNSYNENNGTFNLGVSVQPPFVPEYSYYNGNYAITSNYNICFGNIWGAFNSDYTTGFVLSMAQSGFDTFTLQNYCRQDINS